MLNFDILCDSYMWHPSEILLPSPVGCPQKYKVGDRHASTWRPGSLTCESNFCNILLYFVYIY